MYLSRVMLNMKNRNTIKAFNSPNIFHGAVESCFNGERKRNLWRIDSLNGQLYILILSEDIPDLDSFCRQFGYDDGLQQTKSYDSLLNRISDGGRWRFRITANPTKSIFEKDSGKRGKVTSLVNIDEQKKWLVEKSEKNGFSLEANSFDVVQKKWLCFYKNGGNKISLLSVTYEGFLTVNNSEFFKNAILNGIGREKAYGMGLLTITQK